MGSSGALEPFALEQQGNPFFFHTLSGFIQSLEFLKVLKFAQQYYFPDLQNV